MDERIVADQIVITEKTSQAKDVRAAVGSRYGEILPAEGHLFDLLEPEDVVPAWKHWSPILLRPQDAPEILDRKSCVVVVPDPKSKQFIRYYLERFRIDTAFINKTYAGSETNYSLDVKGTGVIVEYLDLDKSTILHGYKSAQIPLPGDIDQINKALALIARLCRNGKPA